MHSLLSMEYLIEVDDIIQSLFKHVSLCSWFFARHLATHQLNVGVQLRKVIK